MKDICLACGWELEEETYCRCYTREDEKNVIRDVDPALILEDNLPTTTYEFLQSLPDPDEDELALIEAEEAI